MAIIQIGTTAQAQLDTDPITPVRNTTGADFCLGIVHDRSASPAGTFQDTKGNIYSPLTAFASTTHARIRIYHTIGAPIVGAGHQATLIGNTFATVSFLAFSGLDQVSPLDDEDGGAADSSGATIAGGSVSPSADGSLIIAGFTEGNDPGGADPTIDLGFANVHTPFSSPNRGGSAAVLIQDVAAILAPTWTLSGVTEHAFALAVFKAATGGAPSTTLPFRTTLGARRL